MLDDREKIMMLRKALADLLRQTHDPNPAHPAWIKSRSYAAEVYQKTGGNDPWEL